MDPCTSPSERPLGRPISGLWSPSNFNRLHAYRREIFNIFEGTNATGAELSGDLSFFFLGNHYFYSVDLDYDEGA